MYAAIVKDHFDKKEKEAKEADKLTDPKDVKLEQIIDEILQWILTDSVDSKFIQTAGATVFMVSPIAWGYSYSMTYFLFLEAADPGCGALDRDDVYSK